MTGPRKFVYDLLRERLPHFLAFALSGRALEDWGENETEKYGTLGLELFTEFIHEKRSPKDTILISVTGAPAVKTVSIQDEWKGK